MLGRQVSYLYFIFFLGKLVDCFGQVTSTIPRGTDELITFGLHLLWYWSSLWEDKEGSHFLGYTQVPLQAGA